MLADAVQNAIYRISEAFPEEVSAIRLSFHVLLKRFFPYRSFTKAHLFVVSWALLSASSKINCLL